MPVTKRKSSTPKKSLITFKSEPKPKPKPIPKPRGPPKTSSNRKIQKEIKFYQHLIAPLIWRASFIRVVIQICRELDCQFRWKPTALEALQEAVEMYITIFMADANLLAAHSGRVTLFPRDMQLLRRLRTVN